MRYGWLADAVNTLESSPARYELYRPWRAYDAIVFLKSMGEKCCTLAERLRGRSVTVFDANVDYFTPSTGTFYYNDMAPSARQHEQAVTMARQCDGVIGDSLHITEVASKYSRATYCVPDHVRDDLVVHSSSLEWLKQEKLPLLWSGQAHKLFELLAIRTTLEKYASRFRLRLVTNSMAALDKLYEPYRFQLRSLLDKLEWEHILFTSVDGLMKVYDEGGIAISPRFLNNSYNIGHTEWKITLPMARGRFVLCSPQRSYKEVARLSGGGGIKICDDEVAWDRAFTLVLDGHMDWQTEQQSAIGVVRDHYRSSVVAVRHLEFIQSLMAQ